MALLQKKLRIFEFIIDRIFTCWHSRSLVGSSCSGECGIALSLSDHRLLCCYFRKPGYCCRCVFCCLLQIRNYSYPRLSSSDQVRDLYKRTLIRDCNVSPRVVVCGLNANVRACQMKSFVR